MATREDIIRQMSDAGLDPALTAADLLVDGAIHRFQTCGRRDRTGWYVLHEFSTEQGQTLICGRFGDWRLDVNERVLVNARKLPREERERLRRQQQEQARAAKAARELAARQAGERARRAWSRLSVSGESPYLKRKQVRGYGLRYSRKGAAAIPMLDTHGTIHGLQVIHAQSRTTRAGDSITKDFWPAGVSPKGRFYRIGPEPDPRAVIVLCEGYATGASIHEATGYTTFVAFTAGNLLPVAQALRQVYRRNPLVVAGDDDYLTTRPVENPGKVKAEEAAAKCGGVAVLPVFRERPEGTRWTDFNDLHVQEGLHAVRQQVEQAAQSPALQDWRTRFSRNRAGELRSSIDNVVLVLEHDPAWAGVLAYCQFSYRVMKRRAPPFGGEPGEWRDADTARLRVWLAEHYGMVPGVGDVDDAVMVVAEAHGFHPVREYLESLKWDGTPRLDRWLHDYLGAELNSYTAGVGAKWMIAAVARVMEPPVKADCVMILEGPQGMGKSTALSILGGEWFSDTHFTLGDKDGYQQMQGVWICELAELDSFNKAETTRAKQFFSTIVDRYRPSYGRRAENYARQCVFAGSTNQDAYLKDVTGNRRYWPVRIRRLNAQALRRDRDQLWAEAVQQYREGEPWHVLDSELADFEAEQDERFVADAWQELIEAWLYDPVNRMQEYFTSDQILSEALKLEPHQMKPPEQIRVGLIMARLGWKKRRRRLQINGVRRVKHVYLRPPDEGE